MSLDVLSGGDTFLWRSCVASSTIIISVESFKLVAVTVKLTASLATKDQEILRDAPVLRVAANSVGAEGGPGT